jgi:CRP/FNR family cyclic AMP-dependent transcriptional regulator
MDTERAGLGKRTLSKGDVIFKEGQPGQEMYIIQRGSVTLTRTVESKVEVLETLTKGDFFGELAIISQRPRMVTARASEETELLAIDGPNFSSMMRHNVEISARLFKRMAQRLGQAYDQIEVLLRRDNAQRVITFLRTHQASGGLAEISDAELAGQVGLSEEQVESVVDCLEEAGIVHRGLGGGFVLSGAGKSEDFAALREQMVLRDELTGAYNRHYLNERLGAEVAYAVRHGSRLSLLVIDVDSFERIEEGFGASASDLVLRQLGQRIRGGVRVEDVVVRFGGDRFIVICRDTEEGDACLLAERLRASVGHKAFQVGYEELSVTVSVGVAELTMTKLPEADGLIDAAFKTLHVSKIGGGDRVVRYSEQTAVVQG